MTEFYGSIHNHTDRSNFRLRDSINALEELCWYTAETLQHNFISITDHETIATAIDCQKVEKKIREKYPEFKVIRGNEIYLCRNGLNSENFQAGVDKYWHFVLNAKDKEGHRQIRELSTRAWTRGYHAKGMLRVPTYYQDIIDIIGANPGHVIGSTACLGSQLCGYLLNYMQTNDINYYNYAKGWAARMLEIFGEGNFFLETQPSNNKEQIFVNNAIKQLSEELDIPVIITLDAHYLKKEDFNIHKAFLNSQGGDRETESFYATTYMMSREEIHSYMDNFLGHETVTKWMNNSKLIYDQCEDYDLTNPLRIPYLPKTIDVISFEEFKQFEDKISELAYFYNSPYKADNDMAAAIVRKILSDKEQYNNPQTFAAIDECLTAIRLSSEKQNTQWSAYLLNMRDYIQIIWSKGDSLVGPSRGSGGGFMLLNILNITQINPVREKAPLRAWRFLNPERVSPLDIDTDIEGGKRSKVYKAFQDEYGADRVSKVLTIRTEKSKSAILTAARGLGIDIDEAQYLSSFIKSDRGQDRSLKQTFYGDEENDFAPDLKFQTLMTETYPELWEVALKIEGLCNGVGSHAGGVIFYDEDITNTTALMKTNNGDIITQYDLHTAEECGLIKIDLLSVEALDRMRACLDLLVKYGYINGEGKTLKEIYEEAIGVYNLEREAPEMWKMLHNHEVQSLFQMEQQSGIKGIELTKPTTVEELAAINSVMRLMPPEKGAKQPINTFADRKKDFTIWESEMISYGLNKEERKWLHGWLDTSYGICETQETMMSMLQDKAIGGHSLLFADRVRKAVAKKKPKEFLECQKEFYQKAKDEGLSDKLVHYTWDVIFASSRGYSFCMAHTLAYSIIGLQELNLAYKYPIIFWNTANLIVDSGAMNLSDEIGLEEEDEESDEEKIENSSTDYGKMASAIGKMQSSGIKFDLPNINTSEIIYSPDIKNNTIVCGLRGLTRIGNQLIHDIIINRPYSNIEDFLSKVKVNKLQMFSLIKAGCFDSLYSSRFAAMDSYLELIADKKKRITLQNMQMLITKNLIPEEFEFEVRLFNFNKYLKKFKNGDLYNLDNIAMNFFTVNYEENLLESYGASNGELYGTISQKVWDKIYKNGMEPVKTWMRENHDSILEALNQVLLNEAAEKYTEGNISKWEMDSLSFYYHDHELKKLNKTAYSIVDYTDLPNEPVIDKTFETKDGKQIDIYEVNRIAGTVIDKNKTKGIVTLLTPSGVVTVKVWKTQFPIWDKQISRRDEDGTKHVIEKSWFTRGTKLIITGIKRDDTFIPKKYKTTTHPLFEKVEEIDENGYIVKSVTERMEEE